MAHPTGRTPPPNQHYLYGPPPPPIGHPVHHTGAALARAPPRPPSRSIAAAVHAPPSRHAAAPPLPSRPAAAPPLPPRPQPTSRYDTANPFANRACRHRCRTTGAWEGSHHNASTSSRPDTSAHSDLNTSTCLETCRDPLAALPSSAIPHGTPCTRCDRVLGQGWGQVGGERVSDRVGSGLHRSKSLHATTGGSVPGPILRGYTAHCTFAGVAGRQTVGFYDADQIAAALVRAAGGSAREAGMHSTEGARLRSSDLRLAEYQRLRAFVARVLGCMQVQLSVALHAIILLGLSSSLGPSSSLLPSSSLASSSSHAPSSSLVSSALQQRLIATLALAHRADTERGICAGCWAHVANSCSVGEGRAWLGDDAFAPIGIKDASAYSIAPFTKEAIRRNSEALLRGAGYRMHVERVELEEVAMRALANETMGEMGEGAANGTEGQRSRSVRAAPSRQVSYPEMPSRSHSAVPWLPTRAVAQSVRSPEPSPSRYRVAPSTSHSQEPPLSRPLDPGRSRSRTISLGEGAQAAPGGSVLFHPPYRPSPLNAYNTSKASYPPSRPRA
ncbi:hypothetical protein BD626DRAFT_632088 [Schizophyllum amplum]|uniref:Uncharacterized protein n=1 Tax=Schizophyllum amplum TaxID=97359 RepID=A0A550C7Y4_9AGAR|nr:hypothetical protein BD626DRAFT_632088 [Auriculariopsis ampla]